MRRSILYAAIAALSVSACNVAPPNSAGSTPVETAAGVADAVGTPPPVTVADRTTLDESAGLAVEVGVRLAADLATTGVRAGLVPQSRLAELRERVAWLRIAVGSVRAAYDASNADSYKVALAAARCGMDRVRTLATGAPDQVCPAQGQGR